ncbi:hypothetical protein FUA23_02575 [Neolewinella aurantiaca]|uniref:Uncharacterized protein n=1 Tax=Neolewinella aurantiaca TaxID=2602767 RepID=A0A5C7FIX5_9BACT|nr:hypothetical protein [Neolewinella aurantiaca]TXF91132.1 hypothetical protein FUA23_02575 [Neolewinella aurantiaca]
MTRTIYTLFLLLSFIFFSVDLLSQSKDEIQIFTKVGIASSNPKQERFEKAGHSLVIGFEYRTRDMISKIHGIAGLSVESFQHTNFMQGGGYLRQNGVEFPVISHLTRAGFIGGGGFVGLGTEIKKINVKIYYGRSYLLKGNYTKIEIEHLGNEIINTNSPYENLSYGEIISTADNSFRLSENNKRTEDYIGFEMGYRIKENIIAGIDVAGYTNWIFDDVIATNQRFSSNPIQSSRGFGGDAHSRQRLSIRLSLRYTL